MTTATTATMTITTATKSDGASAAAVATIGRSIEALAIIVDQIIVDQGIIVGGEIMGRENLDQAPRAMATFVDPPAMGLAETLMVDAAADQGARVRIADAAPVGLASMLVAGRAVPPATTLSVAIEICQDRAAKTPAGTAAAPADLLMTATRSSQIAVGAAARTVATIVDLDQKAFDLELRVLDPVGRKARQLALPRLNKDGSGSSMS